MKKVSANELKVATSMIHWVAPGGGETSIGHLARVHDLDSDDLYAWAVGRRFMFQGCDVATLEMLPALWEDFASTSRACLAFHMALKELMLSDDVVREWVIACYAGLERYRARRARAHVRG